MARGASRTAGFRSVPFAARRARLYSGAVTGIVQH